MLMTEEMSFKMDISEVVEFANLLDRASIIAQYHIRQAVTKAGLELQRQIEERTPVNTGKLRSSIAFEVSQKATGLHGEVFTPVEYAPPVEYGRQHGRMPPVGPLQLWLTRKYGVRGKVAESMAWGMAINMKNWRDIPGKHMFEKGFNAAKPTIERIFEKVPGDILDEIAGMA